MMSHGSAQDFLRRFWIVTILLVPLVLANENVAHFFNLAPLLLGRWVSFGIATVIFGFALVFFKHAGHEIRMRRYGMMTLVSIAVASGYLFSVASTFIPSLEVEFYLEISTLIWVLLFGHYLEARSSSAAGNALQEVAKLLPKKAHRLQGGREEEVDIAHLSVGDIVLVKPGEKIPADGVIEDGSASVDESLISGESKPVEKKAESEVIAGSLCLDGALTIRLSRVGEQSTIGQIQKLIAEAQSTKPRSQRIADKAAAVLTFTALATAVTALLIWTVVLHAPFIFGLTLAISVLVIACPHALGLAIPTVTAISTSLAVKNGVFIKNLAKLEIIRKATYVVFDKTGTLTKGTFGVTDVRSFGALSETEVLQVAASLEQHSSHIIAQATVQRARGDGIVLSTPQDFKNVPGKGVVGKVRGIRYAVGNRALMREYATIPDDVERIIVELMATGRTLSLVARDEKVEGVVALSDTIKEESLAAVEALHKMGVKVAMLTGDNEGVAKSVAQKLGIDTFFADVLPEDKYRHIQELQKGRAVVLMVGDGVNDAPALTQADVGIAIGAGTDVAVEAGDVVLTRNNPLDVVRLLRLSRAVYTKMIQNLFWALGYNVLAIPAAAGAFATWGFYLRPQFGALLMSLSTVIVVINALMLKRVQL